jgi:uncharacterized membrane protein YhaH (DUF805 family)
MLNDIFSFSGRISRGQFNISLFWCVFATVCVMVLQSYYIHNNYFFFISAALIIVVYYAQMVKRLHDINEPGWKAIIGHTIFMCMFKEGDQGENEHGPDPRMSNVI